MEKKIAYIYALFDPRDNQKPINARYIGKTIETLKSRLGKHLTEIKKEKHHRANWIKSLVNVGLTPDIYLLSVTTESESANLEKLFISLFRLLGANLTNLTDGGDGVGGYRHTTETKEKIRRFNLGKKKSQEIKNILSKAHMGHPVSDETKRKIGNFHKGKILSDETKKKISASKTGRHIRPCSEETKKKISQAHIGTIKPWVSKMNKLRKRKDV